MLTEQAERTAPVTGAAAQPAVAGRAGLSRRRLLRGGAVLAIAGTGAVASWLLPQRDASTARRFDAGPVGALAGWNATLLEALRRAATPPPVAARTLAYSALALYGALQPTLEGLRPLPDVLAGAPVLPGAPRGGVDHTTTTASSLRRCLQALLPAAAVDGLGFSWDAPGEASADAALRERSAAHGQRVADAVVAWARGDGAGSLPPPEDSFVAPLEYEEPLIPGAAGSWIPTPPGYRPALLEGWGSVRPLAVTTIDAYHSPAPTPYSQAPGSAFHELAVEVAAAVDAAGKDDVDTAFFWADEPGVSATPAGHWFSVAGQVLQETGAAIEVSLAAYARLGVAVHDAFVTCWATKYRHDRLRPVTYVQAHLDRHWRPLLTTPPFPEYTSGHSVASAAAAVVLTEQLGERAFADATHEWMGQPVRRFASFTAAAEEAARSRLLAGIHFRDAVEDGLVQGRERGRTAAALAFQG